MLPSTRSRSPRLHASCERSATMGWPNLDLPVALRRHSTAAYARVPARGRQHNHCEDGGRFALVIARALESDDKNGEHPFDQVWPAFLNDLDSNPDRAWIGFWNFAQAYFRDRSPAPMRSMSKECREDCVSDIILSCCQDRFRVLRMYTNRGVPFVRWLAVKAYRMSLDFLRARQRRGFEVPIGADPEEGTMAFDPPDHREPSAERRALLEAVKKCLTTLSLKCQVLLCGAADEMTGEELVVLLGRRLTGDKEDDLNEARRALNDLRHCRSRLKACLKDNGHNMTAAALSH